MKKYKFKTWHLLVILGLVIAVVKGGFLGSILIGQVKDFSFAHFAYAQTSGDEYLWTSNAFNVGSVVMTTEKVGNDHCTNFVYGGKPYHVCDGEEVMLNPYLKVKFTPVFKKQQGGGAGYLS